MDDIRNTTRAMRDDPAEPLLMLGEALVTGSAGSFIERQERDGQRQLVNSDRLPSDHGDDAPWLALGFAFGDPDPDDPMFMPATLPPGWKREGSDHAMWSYIFDDLGRRRVAIFYKAAFYDRSAFARLESVGNYVSSVAYENGIFVLDDSWATRETVLGALLAERDHYARDAAEFRGHAADKARTEQNRAECAHIASEREASAAEWDARAVAFAATWTPEPDADE
jgi:hypothetical protein